MWQKTIFRLKLIPAVFDLESKMVVLFGFVALPRDVIKPCVTSLEHPFQSEECALSFLTPAFLDWPEANPIKQLHVNWGLHSTEVAYLFLTQHPRV